MKDGTMHNNQADIPDQECLSLAQAPLSRRSFFFSAAAVIGALTFQGSAWGGRVMAYADQAGNVHFTIRILSKYETPIMAFDVTDSKSVKRLEGVKVKVTSLFNNKEVAGATDKDGFLPVNIKSLAIHGDSDKMTTYGFHGKLEASLDGYREIYIADTYVESGTPSVDGVRPNTIIVPMQKDDSKPYLRSFLLDGSDIQYVYNAPCFVGATNKIDHTVTVQVAAKKAGANVAVSLLVNGSEVESKKVTAATNGAYLAEAIFTGKWLKDMKAGDTIGVSFAVDGFNKMSFTASLDTKESIIKETENAYLPSTHMMLGQNPDAKKEDVSMPIPAWLGKPFDSMTLGVPGFPIQGFIDLEGNFGIAVTLFQISFLSNHNGDNLLPDGVAFAGFKGMFKPGWQAWWASCKEGLENTKRTLAKTTFDDSHRMAMGPITRDFNIMFSVDLMGYGNVLHVAEGVEPGAPEHNKWSANAAIRLNGIVTGSVVMPFVVGIIPLFVGVDGTAALILRAACGWQFDSHKPSEWRWGYKSDGLDLPQVTNILSLEVGLSVGVGISGVASLAIRGYCSFNIITTFGHGELDPGRLAPDPAVSITIVGSIQVKATILLLDKTWVLASTPTKKIYDSSEKTKLSDADSDAVDHRFADETWTVITDDRMKSVHAESTGKWVKEASGANADSAGKLFFPSYAPIDPKQANIDFTNVTALDPYGASDSEIENLYGRKVNPLNGLVPQIQEKLWDSVFGAPRMRVVHTSTDSFAKDRAFLVRIATVDIEAPSSSANFAIAPSNAGAGSGAAAGAGAGATPEGFVVVAQNGSYRVVKEADAAGANKVADKAFVTRTRVTVSEWNKTACTWGAANVVDFIALGEVTQFDRLNAYDLDFDVDVDADGTLLIAITSLTRPNEASASLSVVDYEKRQYVSLVRWNPDSKTVTSAGSTAPLHGDNRSFFSPKILHQKFDARNASVTKDCCVVYSFDVSYDGNDRTKAGISATVFDDMKPGFGGHRLMPPVDVTPDGLRKSQDPDIISTGVFDVACPNRTKTVPATDDPSHDQSTVVIAWSRPNDDVNPSTSVVASQTYTIVAKSSTANKNNSTDYVPTLNTVSLLDFEGIPEVIKLSSGSNQRGLYSFVDPQEGIAQDKRDSKKPMSMVAIDHDSLKLSHVKGVGDTERLRYFSSFNGRRLYMVRAMEGDVSGNSAFADAKNLQAKSGAYSSPVAGFDPELAAKGGKVKLYQLLEARWVDELNRYYDFYPIAQLPVVPDNIALVAASRNRSDFTFAYNKTFTAGGSNAETSVSDIYQVSIPKVLACDYDEATPVSPFAAPGDKCFYTINLSNCGTAPITSVTLQASFEDGTPIGDPITFDNLAEVAMESPDDVKPRHDEQGALVSTDMASYEADAEKDEFTMAGILWPGKTRPFCFHFVVPESTKPGKVTFNVKVVKVEDKMDDNAAAVEERFRPFVEPASNPNGVLPLISVDDYINRITGDQSWTMQSILDYDDPGQFGIEMEFDLDDDMECGKDDLSMIQAANYVEEGNPFNPVKPVNPDKPDSGDTAKTGDSLGMAGVGLLGAAAAAVATGVYAYERRRAENEAGDAVR